MEITLKLIHGTTFVKAKQKCYNNVASSFLVQPLKSFKLLFLPPILENCVHACNEKNPRKKIRMYFLLLMLQCFFFQGEGEFKGLEGIAVNSKGNILVADRENHRVQIF